MSSLPPTSSTAANSFAPLFEHLMPKRLKMRQGIPLPNREPPDNFRTSFMKVGAWRSLVAHLLGVQKVAGSNPVAPTIFENKKG